jgi:hypothetical protein
MHEYVIEDAFRHEVERRGGLALKFTSQSMNGVPDRIVLLPGAKAFFVELKAPGKMMRPLQVKRKEQLEALGFPVLCVDRFEQILPVIDTLEAWQPGEVIPTVGAVIPKLIRTELSSVRPQGNSESVYPEFKEYDEHKERFGNPVPEFEPLDDEITEETRDSEDSEDSEETENSEETDASANSEDSTTTPTTTTTLTPEERI